MSRFGLDLGRAGVKLVRCDRSGVRAAERQVDPGLDGPERHAALVAALKEAGAELEIGARDELHVAVPRAAAIVKRLTLPEVEPAELERLIRFQALKQLPFEMPDMVLAWGSLGAGEGGGQEIQFAAVRQQTLDELTAIVEEAGLRPGSLGVSTQAAARTLALLGVQAEGEVLLVEVGHTTSDVIVMRQGRMLFARTASVGCGAGEDGAWLERLQQEVVRSLVAARTEGSSERIGPPDALLLAGGGACLPALHQMLEERLKIAPVLLSGLAAGAGEQPQEDGERAARFVVARGLADPREVPGIPMLDLAHRAQHHATRSSRRRALVAAVALVLATIGLAAAGKESLDVRQARLTSIQTERSNLAPRVARARALRGELRQATRWDELKGRELEVVRAVCRALPGADNAFLTQLRWAEGRMMTLTGRAKDWDVVGRFLSNLEKDPLIERVKPGSIAKPKSRNLRGVDFSATVKLRPPRAKGPRS